MFAASAIDERLQSTLLVIVAFTGSLAISALLWRRLGARMRRDRWVRPNYRGQPIAAVGGLLVVAASATVTVVAAVLLVTGALGVGDEAAWASGRAVSMARSSESAVVAGVIATLVLLFGFGWLGYRDDTRGISGESNPQQEYGFRGHLRLSWQQRRLTTGAQKAVGGFATAVAGAQIALWGDPSGGWDHPVKRVSGWTDAVLSALGLQVPPAGMWSVITLARAALIVALGANLLNLLDRAPGRTTKAAMAWWLVLLVPATVAASNWPGRFGFGLGADTVVWAVCAAAVAGGSAGLLRSELAEEHMLGDTGVNPVGAVLAMATVVVGSAGVEWVVLAVLAVLNLASERWSFSRIIDALPPLRWLDRLGSPYRNA